jgi:mitogen-activated protein kinase kinase kinase
MAPEVINYTAHSTKSDIWSIGCLIVEMLTSEHPWASLTHLQAVAKISSLSQPEMPADISQDAKEFLALTFDIEYEKRPSALDALSHPWLATGRGASATASDG